ncbi:ubiquitin carboxyl-terminal hydrolase MINDY-1 isoform X1 [Cinnamomum micranthum f. kanehirae]|uniref:Ubiquitin carboxyl-terminal hydrolase MINDY-1 isoform X1 n=1 Tax=Cinnamomum micranthum f. kanehirae TaxID=337451 RepID=A0A443PAU0_9MAGN|nr:ubiquitin carboxyl-terminal hydrolase MINDY-1 isoform X1 [Cinnamomum micranthum f. kanehirae]
MEEVRNETEEVELEGLYKTKVVHFFGRSLPIILQNDNGPCPLIAISNVLLLRNHLNLSLDMTEISQQKLLSLVAERLIDSNSNVEDKDAGYVKNQQQNIADAIDRLHRLATGIDVNLHFEKINDFEFTPELAIFDLLGIELYHGWIVDPQDTATLAAIGSKSYNALTGELVALETRNTGGEEKGVLGEDCIDFAAATTATLGIPSPSISSPRSFEDSPLPGDSDQRVRKGDLEEEEELMRVLQLSKTNGPPLLQSEEMPDLNLSGSSTSFDENSCLNQSISGVRAGSEGKTGIESESLQRPELNISQDCCNTSVGCNDGLPSGIVSQESDNSFSKIAGVNQLRQSKFNGSERSIISGDSVENTSTDILSENQGVPFLFPGKDASAASDTSKDLKPNPQICTEDTSMLPDYLKLVDNQSDNESKLLPISVVLNEDLDCSDERTVPVDVSEDVASSLAGSEPIYEGEECILDSGHLVYENREPMYEGEIVLAEQTDREAEGDACGPHSKDEITLQHSKKLHNINAEKGELIRNFLKNNASQLTICGLFCLQEGLKERELCVFFRNNHFSTMFKFNDELYLLATDQGYINQPDLVWEKLNEVTGDSVFMTGDFKEFKAESQLNDSWDQQNAMTSTADYLASIDTGGQSSSTLNSDLQLAIALQEQEFEHQPQRPSPHTSQKPSLGSHSRLVTGPQVPRSSNNSSAKQDSKAKDKCVVM